MLSRDERLQGRPHQLSIELVAIAAEAASAKSLEETVVIEVGDLIGITDYFVISSGRNDRQVKAIAEEVERRVKDHDGSSPRPSKGSPMLDGCSWITATSSYTSSTRKPAPTTTSKDCGPTPPGSPSPPAWGEPKPERSSLESGRSEKIGGFRAFGSCRSLRSPAATTGSATFSRWR